MRLFFETAYIGTQYHGWQMQKNAITVQEVITEKLSTIVKKQTEIVGSGRTDTGVHAAQQFFHADVENRWDISHLKNRLNSFLPSDISIKAIRPVNDKAHARFDAIERRYKYQIITSKDPFKYAISHLYRGVLDIDGMNNAAAFLCGGRSFKSFSRVKTDVNHFNCLVKKAQWQWKNDVYTFDIAANRFLRGMVRAIVGTLMDIGKGKLQVEAISKILQSGDRREAGMAAPAKGLCLTHVIYPRKIFIA